MQTDPLRCVPSSLVDIY